MKSAYKWWHVLTSIKITFMKITFGVHQWWQEKGMYNGEKRRGKKKETVTRGSTTSTLFHLLKLNGLFYYTKTLQNARLNLSHKTLIVDWLLNALEAREKIAGSPSTVWHETPASFLFFFPCFIPFQVEIMLLVLTLRQCEIWSYSINQYNLFTKNLFRLLLKTLLQRKCLMKIVLHKN